MMKISLRAVYTSHLFDELIIGLQFMKFDEIWEI